MEFGKLIISSLIIGLFIICLITFGIKFSEENSVENQILQNPSINKAFANISSKLNQSATTANQTRTAMEKESSNPIISLGFLIFSSIFNAGNVFIGVSINMFNMIASLVTETLGISPIIIGVLAAILIISLILAAWSLYKSGT